VVYKQGWLDKRGDLRKNWKRRHFVLKDNTLKYYKKATVRAREQRSPVPTAAAHSDSLRITTKDDCLTRCYIKHNASISYAGC